MVPDAQRDTLATDDRSAAAIPPTPPSPTGFMRQPPSAPFAVAGRGLNWFLRGLGVVLALGAGFTYLYAFNRMELPVPEEEPLIPLLYALVLLGLVLWIALAAGLFRSWWAALFVPAAFYVGALLQLPFTPSGLSVTPVSGSAFVDALFAVFTWLYVALVITMPPAVFGALLGAAISKWIEQRMRR